MGMYMEAFYQLSPFCWLLVLALYYCVAGNVARFEVGDFHDLAKLVKVLLRNVLS